MTLKTLKTDGFVRSVLFLICVYLLALLFFSLFRLATFFGVDYHFPVNVAGDYALQSVAFIRGLRFDSVVSCHVLLLPLVALWVAGCVGRTPLWLRRTVVVYLVVVYALCFVVEAANIPYFSYFFKPINSSIFNWAEYVGTTAGMVVGETSYYLPIALGVLAIVGFALAVVRLMKVSFRNVDFVRTSFSWRRFSVTVLSGIVLVALCIFGIRGRTGVRPIKISAAYYCKDPFLNQLGINPVFNLMTSALDDMQRKSNSIHMMSDQRAIARTQALLNRKGIKGISPIARVVTRTGQPTRQNVVVIIMESMSANFMSTFGNKERLTPFLDSLYHQSMSFSNFYSSGVHTNQGLYSSLYSWPAMNKRNMMKGSVIPTYSGLPTVLKGCGYHTSFFMTHESQYDNMKAFFGINGFDDIYSQEDYPADKIVNCYGVPDDYLFSYALPVLDRQAKSGQPFFSVLLTISNHPPYVIPPTFHAHSAKVEQQIVEYSDWALRRFINAATARQWGSNTIFVLLGDHGRRVGTPECESPQSYNHIPLIIHGKGIKPQIVDNYGGQVDLAPTLLGLLNVGYVQNNFGVDLLREKRPYMYFTADNFIGVRDASHLFLFKPDIGQQFMYSIDGEKIHPATKDNAEFRRMRDYAFSMLQCAEVLTGKQLTLDHKRR